MPPSRISAGAPFLSSPSIFSIQADFFHAGCQWTWEKVTDRIESRNRKLKIVTHLAVEITKSTQSFD
jgi:hypothetical protein